jgi:hypothetical protein
VVDIKMQKLQNAGWDWWWRFFVFMHPCSCLPTIYAHFDWIILSKATHREIYMHMMHS